MATSSTTRVFTPSDYSKITFRGIRWNIWVSFGPGGVVTFTVCAIPRSRLKLRRYARTMSMAKISMEILDGSGKPVAVERTWADQREHRRLHDGTAWIVERIHVARTECAARDDDNNFMFRCTVSEDGVAPGIFAKMNCWKPRAQLVS